MLESLGVQMVVGLGQGVNAVQAYCIDTLMGKQRAHIYMKLFPSR